MLRNSLERRPTGRRGGVGKRALATSLLAAALALAAVAGSALAADRVKAGRTIEAFIGTNLVDVQNYPANKTITIEVLRNGVVVSSVTGKTGADGFAEFNHVGGGQVSRGGDCFKPPVSPDLMPGDVIRTTTAGDPAGARDFATVRDISLDFGTMNTNVAAGTITVSGRVLSTASAPIVPGTDVLELRLNKGSADVWDSNGRKDLREDVGADVQPNGNFTHVFNVSQQDAGDWSANPGEVFLEWSSPALRPPAIFVADEVALDLIGCPPFAEYGVTSSNPKLVNVANAGGGLRLSGIARDAAAVSVTLDDQDADTTDAIPLAGTLRNARVPGFQTWRTEAMTPGQIQRLRALANGVLTARATFTVAGASRGGAVLRIVKDTLAPRKPVAAPKPGTYQRPQSVSLEAQAGTRIHFTRDGSTPTVNSRVFVRPIRVRSTDTIKAIAIDPAGNRSPVASFRYIIR